MSHRLAPTTLALLWTFSQRYFPASSFVTLNSFQRSTLHISTHSSDQKLFIMPLTNAKNSKRAVSATRGKDDATEPAPKMTKKDVKGTKRNDKNQELGTAPSEKKTRAKKEKDAAVAAVAMEADDDSSPRKKKSKKSPANDDDDADNTPKAKKSAAAKHQILTERDEIPKLWNADEHKDSYSECLVIVWMHFMWMSPTTLFFSPRIEFHDSHTAVANT